MTSALRQQDPATAALVPGMQGPSFTRTALAGEIQRVSKAVQAQGEVLITSHNKPEMVLMTVERYIELQQAGRPSLDALSQEFDHLVARMQACSTPVGAASAFAMEGTELGQIALQAAKT